VRQGLELERHMLEHMPEPRSFAQAAPRIRLAPRRRSDAR
jgi:hypothetical protein